MSAVPRPPDAPDVDEPLQRVPMSLAHLGVVLAVEQAVYPFPWTYGNFVDSIVAGHLAQVLRTPAGAIAAYCVALRGAGELHLLNLTVAPPWQGRGLGRSLLDVLVAEGRAEGSAVLWLEVRQSNQRARDVYRRFGFDEVGLRRAYYPAAAGKREDACVMRLVIGTRDAMD